MAAGGHTLVCGLLLERHARVVEAHFPRHSLGEYFFQRLPALAGTVTRRQNAVDLCRPVTIEAYGKFRTRRRFHRHQRREGYWVSVIVPNPEEPDVVGFRAKFSFRLHVHLPHPPETVEIVDKESAHERLERLVDRIQIHTLLEHLVAIDIGEDLRRARDKRRGERRKLRPLARRLKESIRVLRQELDALAGAIFEHERHAAGGADAGNRRR